MIKAKVTRKLNQIKNEVPAAKIGKQMVYQKHRDIPKI